MRSEADLLNKQKTTCFDMPDLRNRSGGICLVGIKALISSRFTILRMTS